MTYSAAVDSSAGTYRRTHLSDSALHHYSDSDLKSREIGAWVLAVVMALGPLSVYAIFGSGP